MYVDTKGTNVCRFEDRVWLVHVHEGNLIQQGSSSTYSEVTIIAINKVHMRFQIMRDNACFGNWESVGWKLEADLYWNEFTTLNTDSKQHV